MDEELKNQVLRGIENDLDPPPQAYAQPHHRLPEGVEHAEGVSDVGRLTAEATLGQFTNMVAAIARAKEQFEIVTRLCDDIKRQCDTGAEQLVALAEKYHEQGKAAFTRLQAESLQLDADRRTIEEMASRFG